MIITREQLKQITGHDLYEGSIIHSRFAYKFYKKTARRTGNILAFIAPMEVTTNLIDLEDSLNADYIYSESAINFIMEIPSIDLFGGVCFQRLFNAQLGSLLCSSKYLQCDGYVDGDDIMINDKETNTFKKASVSIATQVNNAVLIHTGINITAGERAPDFAYSTKLSDEQANLLMQDAIGMFENMVQDIFVATSKVIA